MTTAQMTKPVNGTVSVKLDTTDRERLSRLAIAKKRTSHYLMKEAIHDYLKREEIQLNFIRAAEESANHMDKTGLHVTSGEMAAWVEALKSNPNAPIPQCHV